MSLTNRQMTVYESVDHTRHTRESHSNVLGDFRQGSTFVTTQEDQRPELRNRQLLGSVFPQLSTYSTHNEWNYFKHITRALISEIHYGHELLASQIVRTPNYLSISK
jgi:hypothetical protein